MPYQATVNPLMGAAATSIPLILTSGRTGFSPSLTLQYSSSAGNSVYGMGWSLAGLPVIAISTQDGLPRYDGQDRFAFNGSDELVPVLERQGTIWQPKVAEQGEFWIHYYRSKVERSHIQFEQWVHQETGSVHWRTRGRDSTISIFGQHTDNLSRIADPADPQRTYLWLIEAQYDRQGNAIVYDYEPEDSTGVDRSQNFEFNRLLTTSGFAQRYLKRIRYGNTRPLAPDTPLPADNQWLFEAVFDYGDHRSALFPSPVADQPWPARRDAHSTYRPGFEIRTYRLCRRILMFHHFVELGATPTLLGATELTYREDEAGTVLEELRYRAYRHDLAPRGVTHKALPPLRFAYTAPRLGQSFNPMPEEAQANLPQGISGLGYRWLDLYGEGLPGILTETSAAWYYKANQGNGRFGAQTTVLEKPSLLPGTYALSDFDQDGDINLVVFQGRQAGFYEFDRDREAWKPFRSFASAPHLDLASAKIQWLDLNGDGQADILLSEQDRYIWYPSEGEEGFGEPIELAKPQGAGIAQAPQLAENPNLDLFFADMNGDGLPDLVRVQNGRVEYWPQLGNGRFGDGLLMEDAPILDFEGELDASRMRWVDLDGSGTADLLYLGRGEIRYWTNACGNRFLAENRLTALPYLDNLASVQILDFLGNGTPCLVWSSALPTSVSSPVQYLQLTNGVKPRLLVSIDNSMGRETHFSYSHSSRHYVRDKQAGQEWLSKLPSHLTVVDQVEVVDRISNSRFVSRYEYHDGYFDGEERKFQGFGLVDQYDSEVFVGTTAPETYSAPACSRTWYHNGSFGWETRRFGQFYQGDRRQGLLPPDLVENLAALGADEFEHGIRSLAGLAIRQELYATDATGRRVPHPFQVTQSAYRLRRLQQSHNHYDACFMAYQSEQLACSYEQQSDDPRMSHQLTLSVDDYGNVLEACAIAYPRRAGMAGALPAQEQLYLTAARQTYLNIDQADRRELGLPLASQAFELSGPRPGGAHALFQLDSLRATLQPALDRPQRFNQPFTSAPAGPQARLIGWSRNYYWDDAQAGPLPYGQVGRQTLHHHTAAACFTAELLAETLGERVNPTLLETEGRYDFADGYWWQRGETTHYLSRDAFYLPNRIERLDGGATLYTYDQPYYLTLVEVQDALGNRTRAEIDYHLIAPHRITDANDTIVEVQYDPLGMVVVSAMQGTVLDAVGSSALYGCDRLSAYAAQTAPTFEAILAEPERFLQTANQFFYYELDSWTRLGSPLRSLSLLREDLVYDGRGARSPGGQVQIVIGYLDGFGRALQSKQLVEPGPAVARDASGAVMLDAAGRPQDVEVVAPSRRWLVSGHTVYNNKQQPVRQYEPFFSTTAAFEPDEALRRYGVSASLFYDALGRQIRTELPNGTATRVELTPWSVRSFDPNDTVQASRYRREREALPAGNWERTALTRALAHADTPSIVHLDPLGREVVQVETSAAGPDRVTESRLDIQGNVRELIDARGLTAFTYRYDMLGRALYQRSMDAGESWMLPDALGQLIHTWDGRGVHQRTSFDRLGRPTHTAIDSAFGSRVAQRMVYGEDPDIPDAGARNLRGQLVRHYDQAGTQTVRQYTPEGAPLQTERHLAADYRTEPDWSDPAAVALDPELRFETRVIYDALGRPRSQSLPDGTTRQFDYLPSGGVARVLVSTADGKLQEAPFLEATAYNARGQRQRARLGNGIELTYTYDRETFRMRQLTAVRPDEAAGGHRVYQDITYTYDPVGNLIHHVDQAQEPAAASPLLLQGLNVSSYCDYAYDAFYQLTTATGRVHQALLRDDHRPGLPDPALKHTRFLTLNDGGLVERYTQTYAYDPAGNLAQIQHRGLTQRWTQAMWVSATSNRSLPATDHNDIAISDPESRFDANGNCLYMPHLRAVEWNYRNNIARVVIVDRSDEDGPADSEYYVYGGDGMRLRKVHERLISAGNGTTPDLVEVTEKIYLDGAEIKRVSRNGDLILERTTSHISDGTNRIALLHQWRHDHRRSETDDTSQKRIHYQLSNHLGSASLEVNAVGHEISYEEYFPFGGAAFIAGRDSKEVSLKDYRYSGKERDDATGLYYYGFRYYVPWTGRWLSPDPIGPEDGLNLYQFVRNNPVILVDADGMQSRLPTPWTSSQRSELQRATSIDELADMAQRFGYPIGEQHLPILRQVGVPDAIRLVEGSAVYHQGAVISVDDALEQGLEITPILSTRSPYDISDLSETDIARAAETARLLDSDLPPLAAPLSPQAVSELTQDLPEEAVDLLESYLARPQEDIGTGESHPSDFMFRRGNPDLLAGEPQECVQVCHTSYSGEEFAEGTFRSLGWFVLGIGMIGLGITLSFVSGGTSLSLGFIGVSLIAGGTVEASIGAITFGQLAFGDIDEQAAAEQLDRAAEGTVFADPERTLITGSVILGGALTRPVVGGITGFDTDETVLYQAAGTTSDLYAVVDLFRDGYDGFRSISRVSTAVPDVALSSVDEVRRDALRIAVLRRRAESADLPFSTRSHFREYAIDQILRTGDPELMLLMDETTGDFVRPASRRWRDLYHSEAPEMGHMIAVSLDPSNERFALQWAYSNQVQRIAEARGIPIPREAIDISGLPIEADYADVLVRMGILSPGRVANAPRHPGWNPLEWTTEPGGVAGYWIWHRIPNSSTE